MSLITKEMIQQSIKDQFNLEDQKSRNLKDNRWVLATRRVMTEILETYRFPGDRDNDETFIPYLVDLGLSKGLIMCPFEQIKSEKRIAFYSLKLNKMQLEKFEDVRIEKGWNKQTLLVNAVYTGLLYEFPDFAPGTVWKIQVLEYPLVYQPNLEWLAYQGCKATIIGQDNKRDPWIECSIQTLDKVVVKHLRKDWLYR